MGNPTQPMRFLVFPLTIFLSLIFLYFFFPNWVLQTIPSRRHFRGTPNLGFNDTESLVNSLQNSNSSSSSQIDGISSYDVGAQNRERERGREREREVTVVTGEGNSSLTTPSGKNLSVYGLTEEEEKKGLQEKDYYVNDTDKKMALDESSRGKQGKVSEISFETPPYIGFKKKVEEKGGIVCDITKGKWVIDDNNPLYTYATCPFIDEAFNCEGNGRKDKDYMKWRWQPQDCDIPRFNATKMLELIRRKRLVFVGDSINRNQWESMLCLLLGGVKDQKVCETQRGEISKQSGNFCTKFEEYKCTVEYYVSHFLVQESQARGRKRADTLRIDTIDKGSSQWRGADILVFNSAHWWYHHETKTGINYFQEGNQVHPQLDVTKAYKRALQTWALWVDKYINPRKTQIFFRSSAPVHFRGGLWNTGGHCKEAFWPINETFSPPYPEVNWIVEEVISKMKTSVTLLNITRLSEYRPDAHPSMYGRKSVNPGVQDCSHWCLPGVPDTWNELLYYNLLLRTGNA